MAQGLGKCSRWVSKQWSRTGLCPRMQHSLLQESYEHELTVPSCVPHSNIPRVWHRVRAQPCEPNQRPLSDFRIFRTCLSTVLVVTVVISVSHPPFSGIAENERPFMTRFQSPQSLRRERGGHPSRSPRFSLDLLRRFLQSREGSALFGWVCLVCALQPGVTSATLGSRFSVARA